MPVTSRCIHFRHNRSRLSAATGKAIIVDGSVTANKGVGLLTPFRINHYIISLADDYSWAIVGHPKYKHLRILSRESFMPSQTYKDILRY